MAKYGSDDLIVSIDDSSGSPTVITQHVQELNELDLEGVLEDGHTFGDTWAEKLWTGFKQMSPVTLGGIYDDAAGGPNAILNDVGCAATAAGTRTLLITIGSTKTYSSEVIIQKFTVKPVRPGLTRYTCVLVPTGTVTLA